MGSFSIWHWLIVLVIVLVIFGTKKLRNVGTDIGGAVKGFKSAMNEEDKDKKDDASQRQVRHDDEGQTFDARAEQRDTAEQERKEPK